MDKAHAVERLAAEFDISASEAKRRWDSVMLVLGAGLVEDGEVRLTDIGTLKAKKTAAHEGRNPATGEAIQVAASHRGTMKFLPAMRERLAARLT